MLGSARPMKHDPAGPLKEFERAIQLNPTLLPTHGYYARGLVVASQQESGNRMLTDATRASLTNQQTEHISPDEMKGP